jgi:hypothetical protein
MGSSGTLTILITQVAGGSLACQIHASYMSDSHKRGSQNNFQYKESRYLIENKEGTKRSYVQFGKYLEVKLFNIFKDASGKCNSPPAIFYLMIFADTEWHLIAVRPGCVIKRIEHLQQFLVDMLNEFPYCIWNNEGLPMDARTKKFVDNFEKMVYGDKFYQMHHFG